MRQLFAPERGLAIANISAVPVALTTSTASCWICRSRRRPGLRGRALDSLRAWTTRVRCARIWSGRRRKFREFKPPPPHNLHFPHSQRPMCSPGGGSSSIPSPGSAGERRKQRANGPMSGRNYPWLHPVIPFCTFVCVVEAKADLVHLTGHSRRRRQKSTPRSTARLAQGTPLPSTRFALPTNSISRSVPEIAFLRFQERAR